jgi:hypothetical protein
MGHLTGEIATLVFRDPRRAAPLLYARDTKGHWAQRRLKLASRLQKGLQLLNTAFFLRSPPLSDHRHGDGALSTVALLASMPGITRVINSDRLHGMASSPDKGDRLLHCAMSCAGL